MYSSFPQYYIFLFIIYMFTMTWKDLVCFPVRNKFSFFYLYPEVHLSASAPDCFLEPFVLLLGHSKPPPWGKRPAVTVWAVSRHFLLSSLAALPVCYPGTAGSAGTRWLISWAHLQANGNSFRNLSCDVNSFFTSSWSLGALHNKTWCWGRCYKWDLLISVRWMTHMSQLASLFSGYRSVVCIISAVKPTGACTAGMHSSEPGQRFI